MRTTANVHTTDDTSITSKLLRPAKGDAVPHISIGNDVTIFVTRQSATSLFRAAANVIAEMDAAERDILVATEAAVAV